MSCSGLRLRISISAGLALVGVLFVALSGLILSTAAVGQCVSPQVVGGRYHTLVLLGDGTASAWGRNDSGQLGNGTSQWTPPVSVPAGVLGISGAVSVAAGGWHSMALLADGTLRAWGLGGSGELGNGTFSASQPTPVPVNILAGVIGVACGGNGSRAIKGDGTVWRWGTVPAGLGGIIATPVQVPGLNAITAIATSGGHNLCLKSDATVWSFGHNLYGELGNGTTVSTGTGMPVSNLGAVVAVACGWYHSLALKSDGTVWAWGRNHLGQLGDGTTVDALVPVQVPGISTATAIVGGGDHSLCLKADGTVWGWGLIGSGSAVATSPTLVLSGATAIGAGDAHGLAYTATGSVWAWGDNQNGQLGLGSVGGNLAPTAIPSFDLRGGICIGYQQVSGPGSAIQIVNGNLTPGNEVYNIFSLDTCSGWAGTGPYLGLCASTPVNWQFLLLQASLPTGSPPFHFTAPSSTVSWGPYAVGSATLDAVCFDFTLGMVTSISPVVRMVIH